MSLIVRPRASGRMRSLYRSDPGVLAFWSTRVALCASEGRPASLSLVCLDERLASAAEREGFLVLGLAGRR